MVDVLSDVTRATTRNGCGCVWGLGCLTVGAKRPSLLPCLRRLKPEAQDHVRLLPSARRDPALRANLASP